MEWVIKKKKKASQNTWLIFKNKSEFISFSNWTLAEIKELRVLKNWRAFAYETTSIWA